MKRFVAAVILGGALFTVASCEIVLDIELRDLSLPDAAIDHSSAGTNGASGSGGVGGTAGSGGAAGSSASGGAGGSGGASGSGGSAGAGGSAGSAGDGAVDSGGCTPNAPPPGPTGCCGECATSAACGPCVSVGAAVCVQSPDRSWSYEIDAHEVTRAQFAQFKTAIANGYQPQHGPECTWENSFLETPTGSPDTPVSGVTWCTANAYCRWAGKRLCGAVGSGQGYGFATSEITDPARSEWFNACSNGGLKRYPYGASYEPYRCVGYDWDGQPNFDSQTDVVRPVTHSGGCVGGVPGLFDMSGNLWEWDNSCTATIGADDNCHVRGGSHFDDANTMLCTVGNYTRRGDGARQPFGIRCCKTVPSCGTTDAAMD